MPQILPLTTRQTKPDPRKSRKSQIFQVKCTHDVQSDIKVRIRDLRRSPSACWPDQAGCCRTATPSADFALVTLPHATKLSDEQIEAYLDDHPSWAILSTIDQDGFPHTVPLGYFRFGRDIIMGVRDGTRKVANVESNPNVSILLEDGSSMADIRGVMFQGHARIVREPRETLQLAIEGARARGVPETEWPTAPRLGATYIRMTPVGTVSWDYATSTPDQA